MAKKTDKTVKDLTKEVKKLRKENEKFAKTLEKTREDQAKSHRKILKAIEERLAAAATGGPEEPRTTETAEAVEDQKAPEASADGAQDQEDPEVTDAAKRRAKELSVDPTDVKGTGTGGRVLVKDVETAAGQ